MANNKAFSKLIDRLGGTVEVSKICGLTPSAVSQWRTKGIPRAWVKVLETELAKQRDNRGKP